MSHYSHHVFFCCNQRTNGEKCCNDAGASDVRDYAKKKVKELGLSGDGKVRINMAGCLDRPMWGDKVQLDGKVAVALVAFAPLGATAAQRIESERESGATPGLMPKPPAS